MFGTVTGCEYVSAGAEKLESIAGDSTLGGAARIASVGRVSSPMFGSFGGAVMPKSVRGPVVVPVVLEVDCEPLTDPGVLDPSVIAGVSNAFSRCGRGQ
jgi:hypothetical protein